MKIELATKKLFLIMIALFVLVSVSSTVFAVTFSPNHPESSDDIRCGFTSSRPYLYTFEWFKGDSSTPSHSENGYHGDPDKNPYSTLSSSKTNPGDRWTCKVKANDKWVDTGSTNVKGETSSTPVNSNIIVNINPNDANKNQELTCVMTGTDRSYFYTLEWYVNGGLKKSESAYKGDASQGSSKLAIGKFTSGDVVTCKAKTSMQNQFVSEYSITIINTAPEFTGIGDQTVAEGTELVLELVASDYDNQDELVYSMSYNADDFNESGNPGDAVLDGTTFRWTPNATFVLHPNTTSLGNKFSFSVDDGEDTDTMNLIINVQDTNIAPVISAYTPSLVVNYTVFQNFTLAVSTVTDADGDTPTYAWYDGAGTQLSGTAATYSVTATNNISLAGYNEYVAIVSDGFGGTATVQWNVTLINDTPTLTLSPSAPYTVLENSTINITLTGSDSDGSNFTYGTNFTLGFLNTTISTTGSQIFNFTPSINNVTWPNANWTIPIWFNVTESTTNITSFVYIDLIVLNRNRVPYILSSLPPRINLTEDSYNDTILNLTQIFNETDLGETLRYTANTTNTNLTIVINDTSGMVNITSSGNYSGLTNITFYAWDNWNASNSSTTELNVSAVAEAPYVTGFFWNTSAGLNSTGPNLVSEIAYLLTS